MTLHPEAQQKAQAEIDRVIGNDRLPTLDDQSSLPYLDALMKEVLRWNPVAPLGKPTGPQCHERLLSFSKSADRKGPTRCPTCP